MLSPDFLDGLPDSLVKLYEIAERDILADMARRIGAYDYWISSAEHQKHMLKEMGAEEAYIYQRLALLTGKSVEQLKALFITAANETIDSDGEYYKVAGKKPEKLDTSKNLQKVLNSGMKQTGKTFKNLTRTTAGTSAAAFIKALDRAWMQVSTGAFDHDTAIRTAIKTLSEKGLQTINYGSGKKTSIEAAVRRALLTGLNQTALKLQETLAEEMENDLVEVTAHSGARPDHAKWQGGIYSLSGKSKKYESLKKATGYGTGEGLGGWNCRHNFFPYIEGSPRTYTKESLKAMEARDIEYNGEKMTKYEASQKQRYIERQIRRWKRENAAMKAAGLSTEESAVKIKSWQARQRDFTEKTGLKRQFEREHTAKFDPVTARQADKEAREYYKAWSKSIGANNDETKTLDDYYDMKYNKPEEYRLLKGYTKAVKTGNISPLIGFKQYKAVADEAEEKLIGIKVAGIQIKSVSTHFIDRVIGQADTKHDGKRQGTPIEYVLDALQNYISISEKYTRGNGDIRVNVRGSKADVVVSIRDRRILQTNRNRRLK